MKKEYSNPLTSICVWNTCFAQMLSISSEEKMPEDVPGDPFGAPRRL